MKPPREIYRFKSFRRAKGYLENQQELKLIKDLAKEAEIVPPSNQASII